MQKQRIPFRVCREEQVGKLGTLSRPKKGSCIWGKKFSEFQLMQGDLSLFFFSMLFEEI